MNRDVIRTKIKTFLGKFFGEKGVESLGDDDNFFELGFVNSLFAMQLITFIESEFDVTIDVAELNMDNFNTLHKIVDTIDKKISQR
ncbi:acyl carrier protein [Vallitalea pronyensis]|nr:acyl carrier protein [Vallitalea pronyensis]